MTLRSLMFNKLDLLDHGDFTLYENKVDLFPAMKVVVLGLNI